MTTKYTYDPLGRLEMTVVTSGEVSDTTLRSYNVRGWQTGIQNDSWSAQMRYNNPLLSGSVASFTGNISEWEWTRGEHGDTKAYSFDYDNLSRITGSRLFRNGAQTGALSENGISYDSNGNILSLTRTGEDGSAVTDLTYHYDGNRLTSLSDGDAQSQNYAYDLDGNMTFDGRTGLSLEWNDLGLVEKVSLNGEDLVNYSYLADGTKVSALDGEGDGLLYLGSLIYRKTGNSIELESAGFAGGRFVARESSPGVSCIVPMLHVADHLGSVRAVVDGTTGSVVETNDYYPFGGRWNTTAGQTYQTNRFRYNSKEDQSSLYPSSVRSAVTYIDYGTRQYDPTIGRWLAQDPLSEKYCSISPYAFCGNNPIRFEDVNGEDWYDKIIGYFVGGVTNVVPATGFVRDWYSPDNSADYNSALKRTDETAVVFGTGMLAVGTEMAVVGAVTAATGGVLVMNSSKNKSDGYERGNTSTGKTTKKKSGNQLQRDIEKGKAPKSIDRYDVGKGGYEKPHVHFKDGSALNQDGTWKHGGRDLTNKEMEFLKRYDWETK